MSWIEKLYNTYEACKGHEPPGAEALMPVSHSVQQAHIEITIDGVGNFKGVRIIQKEETVIPATEQSAGRTGKLPPPHPLCDKVQYCAKDYPAHGGIKPSFFEAYRELLSAWCNSAFSHHKAKAVLAYVDTGALVADLIQHKVLHLDSNGKLIVAPAKLSDMWADEDSPEIFRFITPHPEKKTRDQGDVFIRWIVWSNDDLCPEVWKDVALQKAWIAFDAANNTETGLCMVTGEEAVLAFSHPKRIRHGGDGAKLISANDSSGFTFRGRFTDSDGKQAAGVDYVITQKAHSALRWLIKRQGYRNGDQTFVAWAVAGKPIPDPWADSSSIILGIKDDTPPETNELQPLVGDVGQAFALRLRRAIAGYSAKLDKNDDIVIMGVDSATPGRMAIIYYRELKGSEFLERIEAWHTTCAWPQDFGKDKDGKPRRFTGAPAPHDIAEAAYATRIGTTGELRLDDKLRKITVERLLPCIIEGRPISRDLVMSLVRRASNRVGFKHWEWEKILGIACGLFRGWSKSQGKEYAMSLEEDRTSRDYLYGRLLAVADNIESYALGMTEKARDTGAAQLMQRFADHPYSTWRTIKVRLQPYISRLQSSESEKVRNFLANRKNTLDKIHCRFVSTDFMDDRPLSGEFLLGYHCQRAALFAVTNPDSDSQNADQSNSEDNTP